MKSEELAFFAAGILVGAVGAALLTCPEAKKVRQKTAEAVCKTKAAVKTAGEAVKKTVEEKVAACKACKAMQEKTAEPTETEAFTAEAEAPAEA